MKGSLLRILAFLLLYSGLVALVKRQLPLHYGNEQVARKAADLRHLGDSVDVVFIGSSRMYRGLVPTVFDSLAPRPGRRAYNLGVAAMTIVPAFRLAEGLLDDPALTPGLTHLFLEVQDLPPIEQALMGKYRETHWHSWREFAWITRAVLGSTKAWTAKAMVLKTHLTATLYGSTLTGEYLALRNTLREEHYGSEKVGRNGYYPLEQEVMDNDRPEVTAGLLQGRQALLDDPAELARRMNEAVAAHDAAEAEPGAAWLARYTALQERCRARGITLVLVLPPRGATPYTTATLRRLAHLPQLDLSDPRRYPDLYAVERSFDAGHLDRAGAIRFTQYLVEAWAGHRH
ncbi:MAG: hypothetical protein R2817_14260 [Flavobacteriales bacterium]